jgi:hypothetical protein
MVDSLVNLLLESELNKNKLPFVNWPDSSGTYKIIQLESNGNAYLRFGNGKGSDCHEHILERFADEIGAACDVCDCEDNPVYCLPKDCSWSMEGAGLCNLDLAEKVAFFSGRSGDYGRAIDRKHLQKLQEEFSDWQIRY